MTATVTSVGRGFPALAAPLACGCCLVAATTYVALDDPSNGGAYLPCPFRSLTGLWCPGCGLTRATHHLVRGDLVQALRFNVFVVAVLASLAMAWIGWVLSAVGRPVGWSARIPVRVQVAAGLVLVAFAAVRNLPAVSGLRG